MADLLPPVIARLVADVGDFVRGMDEAGDAAERAARRIREAGAAAGNGPDTSHFRDLNAELERLTRTAREAANAIRDHGNASRRAGDDVESLRRRLNELDGGMRNAGSSASSLLGKISPMTAVWVALASILPGIIAGIFALGAALTGIALAAGVAMLGAKGLGQAFDRLQANIAPLKAQLDSVFRAQLSQEMAKLGQVITSELAPAFKIVAGAISDVIKDTSEWIRSSEGISTIKQAMGGVTDLVRELSPAVKGLVQIFLEFAASAAPSMGKIGDAISEVVTRIRDLFREANKSGQLTRIFEAGAEAIKGFGQILEGVIAILMEMADQGGKPAAEAMKNLGQAMKDAAPAIGALFANLARAAEIISKVIAVVAKLGPALADIINPIRALQRAFPEATKGMESFTVGLGKIGPAFAKIKGDIDKFVATVKAGFDKVVQNVKAGADKVVQDIKQWWDKNVAAVKAGVDKLVQNVKSGFDKANSEIKQTVDRMVQTAKEWWDKTVQAVSSGIDKANQAIKDGLDKAVQAVKDMTDQFVQAGKDMVMGLIKGAKEQADALAKVFEDMAKAALAAAKRALGIASPSKLFADEVGQHIPGGIAQGILAGTPALQAALARSMRTLPLTANVALAGAGARGAAVGLGGGASKQVIEVKLDVGSGGDGAAGAMIAGLARRGQLKITSNAIVGGRK